MRRVMWAVVLGASALAAGAKDAGPKPIDVAALAIQHETSEVAFFARDALPPLSMNRTHPRHLEQVFLRLDDPTLPTYLE